MLSKVKMSFLTILACLSLISVGFAAWGINVDTNISVDKIGSITTDVVIDQRDKNLKYDLNILNRLRCYKYGFVDESDNYVKTGNIEIEYTIDLDKYRLLDEEENDSLKVNIELKYSNTSEDENIKNYNIFSDQEMPLEVIVSYNGLDLDVTLVSNTNNKYEISFILNNILSDSNTNNIFKVTYKWTIDSDNLEYCDISNEENKCTNYFNENIWPVLSEDVNPKFELHTTIQK